MSISMVVILLYFNSWSIEEAMGECIDLQQFQLFHVDF